MSDIVSDAKEWLERRDNQTLRTHSEHCHHVHVECLVARLVAEVERHRMTEAERVGMEAARDFMRTSRVDLVPHIAGVLRNYLDRTAQKEVGRE